MKKILFLQILILFLIEPITKAYAKTSIDFIGDSRTVGITIAINGGDISKTKKVNKELDNIRFIGKVSSSYRFLQSMVESSNAETIVSWMGVNNLDWDKYKAVYDSILKQKKKLILVSISPIDETKYRGGCSNKLIKRFNRKLFKYAKKNKVPVIDSYSFVTSYGDTTGDGLHYDMQTYTDLYYFIVGELYEKSDLGNN